MKKNFASILNSGKMKVATIAACAALVLTLGTGIALATNSPEGSGSMMMRTENGHTSFSTDDGQTWKEGAPEGATIEQADNGATFVRMGTPPANGAKGGLMGKNENGNMSYSTDGGQTWSNTVPDGFQTSVGTDGSVSIKSK